MNAKEKSLKVAAKLLQPMGRNVSYNKYSCISVNFSFAKLCLNKRSAQPNPYHKYGNSQLKVVVGRATFLQLLASCFTQNISVIQKSLDFFSVFYFVSQ